MKKILTLIVFLMCSTVYAAEGVYFAPVFTLMATDSTAGDTTSKTLDIIDSLSGIRVPENLTFFFSTTRFVPGVETTEITIQSSHNGTTWFNVGKNDAIWDLNAQVNSSISLSTSVDARYYRIDFNPTAGTTQFGYDVKVVGFTYERGRK